MYINKVISAEFYLYKTNNEKDTVKLPEDFWAFRFELTNCHLFQLNLTPALHDSDVTVT